MGNNYVIRKAAGQHFLLRLSGEKYYQPLILNESAYVIFRFYEKGYDNDRISRELAKHYEIDVSAVEEDVAVMTERIKKYLA